MIEPEENGELDKMRRYNISSLKHTFANFKKVEGTEKALELMQKVAEGKSDRTFILLNGSAGCGKTYLLEALILAWEAQGKWAYYETMSQIVRRLKMSMHTGAIPPYDVVFKKLCERERLIVDDVGMGTVESKWEIAELEDIINERYHRRYYGNGWITILATNKDITELPDRIVSRFYDPEFGVVVHISAKDYRRRRNG
jgi:DNA replication protein DnaC